MTRIEKTGTRPVHVLSVSMPRSGHHLFTSILQEILGQSFSHCEFYTPPECCGHIPCSSVNGTRGVRLFLQKSHDLDFNHPVDTSATLQLIQHRRPIPRLLSHYATHIEIGGKDSDEAFRAFVADRAVYSIRFYRKWLIDDLDVRFVLDYDSLCADPGRWVRKFLSFCRIDADTADINTAVAKMIKLRGGNSQFRFRSVESYERYDPDWFALVEHFIVTGCNGYHPAPQVPAPTLTKPQSNLFRELQKAIDQSDWAKARGLAHVLLVQKQLRPAGSPQVSNRGRHAPAAERQAIILEANALEAKRDAYIEERHSLAAEPTALVREKAAELDIDRDRLAAERDGYAQELYESNRHASFLAGERQRLLDDNSARRAEIGALHAEVAALRAQISGVYASTSWRISRPVRGLKQLLTRRRS